VEVLVLGNVLLIWQLLMMLKYIAFRERNNIDISQLEAEKGVKNVFNIEGKIDFIVNTAGYYIKKQWSIKLSESINTNYFGMINIAIASLRI
jgi:dTDP-4-dehydrorhamnose reductase